MLMLYTSVNPTDEQTKTNNEESITFRWYDVNNGYSVREFSLQVTKNADENDGKVQAMTQVGHIYHMDLQECPGSGSVSTMVKSMKGLHIVCDLSRVSQGHIHFSGVTMVRIILSAAISGASILLYGWPFLSSELEKYGAMLSLWALLYSWGFKPWLGEASVPFSTVLDDYKLAVLYGAAHGTGSRLFERKNSSWSMKLFDGTFKLPPVNAVELYFSTQTIVTRENNAYQMAMSDAFITCGTISQNTDGFLTVVWEEIVRGGHIPSGKHITDGRLVA